MFHTITRAALISSISFIVSACDDNGTDFSIGGPSTNNYFLGKSSPQNFSRAMPEAQSCVWSGAKNCGVKIDAAKTYARSDFDLYSVSKMEIEYWEAQGNIITAQRAAVRLLQSLPGNSYATDFLRRNPPAPADIGLSRGTLIAIGAIVVAAQAGTSAMASGGRTFQCTVACSTNALAATMGTVGDSARDITVPVRASSASAASRLAMDDRGKICRQAQLSPVATIVKPTCR